MEGSPSPGLSPCSPISNSGDSRPSSSSSRDDEPSWKGKLAPFLPKDNHRSIINKNEQHDGADALLPPRRPSNQVQLELYNTVDDELLVVLRQVVQTILQNKHQEVTKGALYRVLRKFARCQVDIQSLKSELQVTKEQLDQCRLQQQQQEMQQQGGLDDPIASSSSSSSDDRAHQLLTAQQIIKLQQMIIDLEQLHAKQRSKYEQALTHAKSTIKDNRHSLDAATLHCDDLQHQLDQQRSATSMCEQVIQALRETLLEKDAAIGRANQAAEELQAQLDETSHLVALRDEKIAQLQDQLEQLQDQLEQLQVSIARREDEAKLKEMNERVLLTTALQSTPVKPDVSVKRQTTADADKNGMTDMEVDEVQPDDGKVGGFMVSRPVGIGRVQELASIENDATDCMPDYEVKLPDGTEGGFMLARRGESIQEEKEDKLIETDVLNVQEYEVQLEDGKVGGFMLSRANEIQRQLSEQGASTTLTRSCEIAAFPQSNAIDDQSKPWRVDELRKRRNTQEVDMKQQLQRIGKASSVMTGGQATAQSPDREPFGTVAPNSPAERQVATLKTHIAVQEALMAERDSTIEHLEAQVKDLSTKLDATVALTASLAMRDLARTQTGDDGECQAVDTSEVDELRRTLKHSEGKVAKLKQELAASKRKLINGEQKITLLETFIMEDIRDQDAVVFGEVTKSQRRSKTMDLFEESTRSILDESQMLAQEKDSLKSEAYELKSQLKIAQAMVSDLDKDRKLLKARIAHIDPLGELKEKSDIEVKVYELSLKLADLTVERDALAEELQMGNQRIGRLESVVHIARSDLPDEADSQIAADLSESLGAASEHSIPLSFFSGQEQRISPHSPSRSQGRHATSREGIRSLFAPKSPEKSDVKRLEQRISDLETENYAYAASVDALKRRLSESMPGHYAK